MSYHILYHIVLHRAVWHLIVSCCVMSYHVMSFCLVSVLCHAVPYRTIPCHAMWYMIWYDIRYDIWYDVIWYDIIHHTMSYHVMSHDIMSWHAMPNISSITTLWGRGYIWIFFFRWPGFVPRYENSPYLGDLWTWFIMPKLACRSFICQQILLFRYWQKLIEQIVHEDKLMTSAY